MDKYLDIWRNTWQGLGVGQPNIELLRKVLYFYAMTERPYYNLTRLDECLELLPHVTKFAMYPYELEVAVWFHGAIFQEHRMNSEQKSAEWAYTATVKEGVSKEAAKRIYHMIIATNPENKPAKLDEKIMVDIDLSILGADQMRYREYEKQLREQYRWIPEPTFIRRRQKLLFSYLKREHIFNTAFFNREFEEQARENIKFGLGVLTRELDEITS